MKLRLLLPEPVCHGCMADLDNVVVVNNNVFLTL